MIKHELLICRLAPQVNVGLLRNFRGQVVWLPAQYTMTTTTEEEEEEELVVVLRVGTLTIFSRVGF